MGAYANKEVTDDIAVYLEDREYIANKYVMKCFFITMVFFVVSFVLNLLNIFVVDQDVMASGFYPSLVIYCIMWLVTRKVSLSNPKTKYFILLGMMVVYTIMGVTITYHVVLTSILPFLYATLYSSKRIMKYSYGLAVASTFITVYGGYNWGLCDANMALLTTGRLSEYVSGNQFLLTTVNENPLFTLALFFVLPRCLIYIAVAFVCNNIIRIVSGSLEKAKLTAELEKAKIEAENANNAKSKFLARMSHEIRTPINAIFGMNEMILRESKNPAIQKYASDAKDSSVILLGIVNEILDSSKIESGMMELVPVNYHPGAWLNDIYNMMNVRAREKGLELKFEIDSTIPGELYGDDKRIGQVLINLLSNGVKYTDKGSVTLSINCERKEDVAVLYFSIKDTGIGIKQEDLGKLYEEFKRIDLGRNRNVEGTGLGLSIAKQLLLLMYSDLQIESEYGKGSEFFFALEQKIVNPEPIGDFVQRDTQTVASGGEKMFTAPLAKILIVDDVAMNRTVFKVLLKQTGIQVLEAQSGEECLEILQKESVHIVFLDHMMPGMDGIETKHQIAKMNLCPGVPIVMLTANALLEDRELYRKEGFDAFLSKPIMVAKLEKLILKFLPKELITEGAYAQPEESAEAVMELPELEEFDFSYALGILQKEELLMKFLEDFYKTLEPLQERLDFLNENLEEEEILSEYRTGVHSLKSTAATVGALLLSKTARLSEMAAIEKDLSKVRVLHPILQEEISKHKARIGTMLRPKEKESAEFVEAAYLDMLKMSLERDDYTTADMVCGEMQKKMYPGKLQELVEKLAGQVFNLDAENALLTIEEIKGKE